MTAAQVHKAVSKCLNTLNGSEFPNRCQPDALSCSGFSDNCEPYGNGEGGDGELDLGGVIACNDLESVAHTVIDAEKVRANEAIDPVIWTRFFSLLKVIENAAGEKGLMAGLRGQTMRFWRSDKGHPYVVRWNPGTGDVSFNHGEGEVVIRSITTVEVALDIAVTECARPKLRKARTEKALATV